MLNLTIITIYDNTDNDLAELLGVLHNRSDALPVDVLTTEYIDNILPLKYYGNYEREERGGREGESKIGEKSDRSQSMRFLSCILFAY